MSNTVTTYLVLGIFIPRRALFDEVPPKYTCRREHVYEGDSPPKFCPDCGGKFEAATRFKLKPDKAKLLQRYFKWSPDFNLIGEGVGETFSNKGGRPDLCEMEGQEDLILHVSLAENGGYNYGSYHSQVSLTQLQEHAEKLRKTVLDLELTHDLEHKEPAVFLIRRAEC